ncbi:hypothetical protein A0256_11535 [Mucilaginibacter sp. PAMC 26640]|nr:hypothetical protein A0256_11535 [Mucilaginibacter sp. PAMC 26640]
MRPVDVFFSRLDASHKNATNRLLHYICVPLMLFALLAITWAIPFPYLKFIGSYNGMFNWASFLIAFCVYYTLKLSPILSYTMLILLFGLSYGVSLLAAWELAGGIPLIWMGTLLLAIAWLGQYLGSKQEGNPASFKDDTQLVLITPIWVLYSLFKRLGWRY